MAENMVVVPRAEVLRLLGLPADSALSDAELVERAERRAAELASERSVAAAEHAARAEDHRLVIDAYNAGKLGRKDRIEFWVDALRRDRENNRAVLASLAPGLLPAERLVVDAEVEATHRKVLERLGFQPPPRTVAASEQSTPYQEAVRNADGFGQRSGERLADPFAKSDLPAPVRISRGKPVSEWTDRERSDAMQRRLGPAFYPGTKPPPKGDKWFQPSGDEPYEFVPNADGNGGHWREKPNDRAHD